MPEDIQDQKPKDFLEELLVTATERAAKFEAEEALRKGYVTREQINMALDAFGNKLQETLIDKIMGVIEDKTRDSVKKAIESDDLLAKAGVRKSTVTTPEEEREADPIAFLLKKGQAAAKSGNDPDYDDIDKRIMWAVTEAALSQGMLIDQNED